MKSKILKASVATLLLAGAGLASAAEPVTLTDTQMDTVAAGAVTSISAGFGAALFGAGASASQTAAVLTPTSASTAAASAALGFGVLPIAATAAASQIN